MFAWLKKLPFPTSQVSRAVEADATSESAIPSALIDESTAHKNMGDKLFDVGNLKDAAACYQRAIEIYPAFAEAFNNLGIVYREQGLSDNAERYFKKAILINPSLANAYYNLGSLLLKKRMYDEAIANLSKALEHRPDVEIIYRDLTYALFQTERYEAAKQVVAKGITLNPNFADFHSFMGNLYLHANELAQAVACYQRALSIQPDNANVYTTLGKIFQKEGKLQEAVDSYHKAIALKPDYAELYYELGIIFQKQQNLNEALLAFKKVLMLNPGFVEAHIYLGNVFNEQGKPDEALIHYQSALSINPALVEAHVNKGNILKNQGKSDEAMACYQRALELKPDALEAHINSGLILKSQGELNKAMACYQKALSLKPDFADAYNNLGNVYFEKNLLNEALACYRKAIAINSDFADAYYSMGAIYIVQRKNDEAIANFRKVLSIEPEHNTARTLMLHQLQHMCEWEDLITIIHTVRHAVFNTPANGKNLFPPFAFLAIPGATAEEQKQCAERWAHSEYQTLTSLRNKLDFKFNILKNKTISIGYISADLRHHPVAFLMAEVFELHDRSRFKIIAYAYDTDESSAMRKRLESAFDEFVDITDYTYEQAASKIYDDHIDILVDLTGHTQSNRCGILALRPAPVQVNYLGYPGTMGADFFDYLIADRFAIPPGMTQHYTEEVVWMPDCFQANDRSRPRLAAPTRESCRLPESAFVYCCFNQTYKITPEVFDIWCRLLTAVPDSVFWIPACNPHAESNLRREAETRGIAKDRLVMAPLLNRDEHLARMQCADLFLDTLPYNAGTTCSDALWMGLPVITCAGDSFVSRMAGSLLTAIGTPELVTYNLEDYYQLALDLAIDRNKLESIRKKIIHNRDTSPLFDSVRFTRNLERAYIQMMDEYQKKSASSINHHF